MESDRIKSWPVKERPREKLLADGAEKQTDADLLAIILRVGRGTFKKGVPGQNAQAFARKLLSEFNGLRGLDRTLVPELLKVSGVSKAKVAQIKAAFELGKRVCTKRLTALTFESSAGVAAHFRPRLTGNRQETFYHVLIFKRYRP